MTSWVRLWHDMPTDPKFRTIARAAKQPLPTIIAIFTFMLADASANATERGRTTATDEDIASAFDLADEDVKAVRAAMQGRVLDGDRLTGWESRQPKKEDDSAARAKAWREEQKAIAEAERLRTTSNDCERPDADADADAKTKDKPLAQHPKPAAPRDRMDRLFEAAGIRGNPPTAMAFASEIFALEQGGYDFETEIIPGIACKPKPDARTWGYFAPQIHEFVRKKRGAVAAAQAAPKAATFNWRAALQMFRDDGTWNSGWGPKPNERDCRAPQEFLSAFGFGMAAA